MTENEIAKIIVDTAQRSKLQLKKRFKPLISQIALIINKKIIRVISEISD